MYREHYKLLLKGYSMQTISQMMGESYETTKRGMLRFARKNNLPSVSELGHLHEKKVEYLMEKLENIGKDEPKQKREPKLGFIEEYSTKENGEISSTRLIDKRALKDEMSILLAHDLDPEIFTLVSHRHSRWDSVAGGENYSSRVTVKPKKHSLTQEELLDNILTAISIVEPMEVEEHEIQACKERTLVIPLYDLHYQADNEDFYYDEFLPRLNEIIKEKQPERAVIIFGGDGLEHDNFVFTTESGTRTEDTDIEQDYIQLFSFLNKVLHITAEQIERVEFIYIRGNHSPSMDWALSHALERANSNRLNVSFDLGLDTLKFTTVYDSFIGLKHGHINSKEREADTLVYLNPKAFASCKYHYMFTGHYHSIKEYVVDRSSIFYIQFPSPAINNQWARDLQFNAQFSGLRLMLFEPYQGITEDFYIRHHI